MCPPCERRARHFPANRRGRTEYLTCTATNPTPERFDLPGKIGPGGKVDTAAVFPTTDGVPDGGAPARLRRSGHIEKAQESALTMISAISSLLESDEDT